ncbi:unnamed protein product [Sphagnum troendelagicum]|uniref:Protein kinase domain-containing protein n=1 Tax=Sphagnum troendelagicum TaxID=128251 RepID=A0ABP0UQJ6_9BRYO
MLASISHPHIVQVFGRSIDKQTSECSLVMELMHKDLNDQIDAFTKSTSGASFSLVMELMHKDLNDQIDAFTKSTSGASFELPAALGIMLQIADAMLYLHKKEIVHRDLKARNILINHVKITEMVNSDIEKRSEMKEAVKKGMRPALPDSLPASMMSLIKRCWDADPSIRPSSHGYALN